MSSNHFNYFRVKNFKRFKDLEVKDIGQFNLVLGDNNVGKTSLLEALMLVENEFHTLDKLGKVFHRNRWKEFRVGDVFDFFLNKSSTDNIISFASKNDEDNLYELKLVKSEIDLELISSLKDQKATESLGHVAGNLPHIKVNILYAFDFDYFMLSDIYSRLVQKERRKRSKLVDSLKVTIENISALESSVFNEEPTFLIETSDSDYLIPINSYGDGTQSVFSMILYLELFAGDKLMIDEIDAGIHYSRMKDYWKVILQSAKENDVQLFATTHNKECMEGFQAALEELGADYTSEARAITLKQSPKTGDIVAFTNSFEVLDDALEIGNDLR